MDFTIRHPLLFFAEIQNCFSLHNMKNVNKNFAITSADNLLIMKDKLQLRRLV